MSSIAACSVWMLGLLVALCLPESASAAAHRDQEWRHAVVHPANARRPLSFGSDPGVPPGWYKFPGYPPIPPSENRNLDPSNFGGG